MSGPLTTSEVARRIGRTPERVRAMCESGELVGQKSRFRSSKRSRWYVTEEMLAAWERGEWLREAQGR